MKPVPVYPKPLKNKASLLFTFFKKRHSSLHGLFERSYRMKMGHVKLPGIDLFMPNTPSLVHRIMTEEVELFPKHPMLGKLLEPLMGKNLFTSNGDEWRKQRNMLDIAFDNKRVELVLNSMQSATDNMLERLNTYSDGQTINIEPELTFVTADIIFRTILSTNMDNQEAQSVMHAFTRFQAATQKRAIFWTFNIPDNRLFRFFDRQRYQDATLIRESLRRVIEPRHSTFLQTGKDHHNDILSVILASQNKETGETFCLEEIIDHVATLFLGGHETSSSALTWTLYLLAIHPDIQQEAAEEVLNLLANQEETSEISLSTIKQLSLIRKIFTETLRLYPSVGFLAREAKCPINMRDKHIPTGAAVIVSPWLLHRHRELWDEPDNFCPNRFQRKNGGKGVPKNAYLPFGLGQRACIGATFATQEAILIIASLLARYTFELAPGFQPEPVGRLTIRPANGMNLIIRKRTSNATNPSSISDSLSTDNK